jgi:hypothetical protein
MNAAEDMTMAVTSTENVGMTVAAMCIPGVFITIMATGDDIMPRRQSSMHRIQNRASVSFSQFIKGVDSRRLPGFQAELIWAAVATNFVRYK